MGISKMETFELASGVSVYVQGTIAVADRISLSFDSSSQTFMQVMTRAEASKLVVLLTKLINEE